MNIRNAKELKKVECPTCKMNLDRCNSKDDQAVPTPGCVNLCVYCGTFAMFDDNMGLRFMTNEEKEEFDKQCPFEKAMVEVMKENYQRELARHLMFGTSSNEPIDL